MDYQQPPVPPSSPSSSLFQLNIDAQNSYTLRSAASWGKVLGVVGIIFSILIFGFAILFQTQMDRLGGTRYYDNDFGGSNMRTAGTMGMIMYVIGGLLFLIGSIFVLNFGNKISRALKTNDQNALSGGFAAARNYFAFWAILLIIFLLLLLIGIVGMLGSAR